MASPNNPVDLTFDLNFPLFYEQVPKIIWESGEVDVLIFYGIFGSSILKRSLEYNKGEFKEMFPFEGMHFVMQETLDKFFKWVHENQIPVLISCIDTADDVIVNLKNNSIQILKWQNMTLKELAELIKYFVK